MFKAMASFFSSLLLDIFTYHFTWWKLVDKNSIVSSYMGINAITNVGISLVTVGKKYLSNQNVSSESLCRGQFFHLYNNPKSSEEKVPTHSFSFCMDSPQKQTAAG